MVSNGQEKMPMSTIRSSVVAFLLVAGSSCFAQLANQVQLKIDPSNRTLTVSADERVTAEPDLAIVHIGFLTTPSDAKQAYSNGSRASNQIISALKQAGISEASIRSESQTLESSDPKAHKFQLQQSWVVEVPPARVAEILDIAVTAGATESGQVEWTVHDVKALEDQALEKAAARAQSDAVVLAKGMGVRLGRLIYTTNQLSSGAAPYSYGVANFSAQAADRRASAPLAIEPHKVSRSATVYAVYSIE
jgi:uncharacterized protein